MKKLIFLITVFTSSSKVFAQNDGMMNNRNYNGNYSFSLEEMLLGGILLVLIVAGMVWFFNNSRKGK